MEILRLRAWGVGTGIEIDVCGAGVDQHFEVGGAPDGEVREPESLVLGQLNRVYSRRAIALDH